MVEISKALSNDSKILVLDEPTAAITDTETKLLFKIICELRKEGLGIIYISHRLEELFEIGDRCTVLRDGELVGTVDISEVTHGMLTKMMVGRSISMDRCQNLDFACDDVMLDVVNLSYKNLVKNASFQLKRGEILGISGLVGSGRTELAKCILGAYKIDEGEIYCFGEKMKPGSISEAIGRGIVYLSEDRQQEGLIQIHNFVDNVLLPNYKIFDTKLLRNAPMKKIANEIIPKLSIKIVDTSAPVQTLSGGNQQKVVIGKWLLSDASIFIFDEPTRGID
ncbi:MAG: sugar ABC transporter ATP-binding protein, partial [Clostridiaceae bacterium]|nr:sugar ABC transporter ATP-binding protein [Clostridiaceae bacterium]